MNKQMIEEMEKDIAVRMAMAKSVAGSMYNGVEGWLAEYLIEKGWIKPTENVVVLTKEEYERHKGFSREEVDEIIETAIPNLRKATAKEILEELDLFFKGTTFRKGYEFKKINKKT